MTTATATKQWTCQERLDALRRTKLAYTREKQEIIGSMDYDDWGLILPPEEYREVVRSVSGSGVEVVEVRIKGVEIESNHPSGGFFGPKACGENYRRLLDAHPVYLDPMSSLAGGYMVNFYAYRKVGWNPDYDFSHLMPERQKYQLVGAIGGIQHFCQDLQIGLDLGWGGLLNKIRHYRPQHPEASDFYDGLESVVLGAQDWIRRHVVAARHMAQEEQNPQLRQNLLEIADMNERLVDAPPATFREACQWILWYQIFSRMYNGSGSLGRLDALLKPYYERDTAAGILTDEDAILHIASYLVRETGYIQVGGLDASGHDVTNPVSYLILEAAHRLRIPANIGVCVGKGVDPGLLRRGVEIQFEDKAAMPKFLGMDALIEGFVKNGYPVELARERAYSGCHWFAIPGREYTLNDLVKINLAAVLDVALKEMFAESDAPSVAEAWQRFESHLRRAVEVTAESIDLQIEHMHKIFPELALDLLCHGPIEKGLDASHFGVEYYNIGVDGSALAIAADSFAAMQQRIEQEHRLTWAQLQHYLETDWAGPEGEQARLMMQSTPRYGSGGSLADEYAVRISQLFTRLVKEKPTPGGLNMIPGLFSWAATISMGAGLGATPNGRHAGAPISHGANPNPGFRKDGAPSAMATAIAQVQSGYGNPAPMQIEFDPGISRDEGGLEKVMSLMQTHFELGGTEINMNVMDADKVREAHKDPSKYPDLIVRVTGFSAYFASLSPEFRQIIVDRIVADA
ncbi:MAG: formate acetyltransferase [Chloroflexi bacterium]|jgi:pyruvate-formate lyase|nr:formate acetyltransferase [Chloroflexota bacterium]